MSERRHIASRYGFRIRRATLRDLEELVHQRRGMWEDMRVGDRDSLDAADMAFRNWVKSEITKGKLVAWIVETTGNVVVGGGCLWLRPAQPRPRPGKLAVPYLLSMFTEPGFRRKGVASRIVKEAIRWSRKNGYPSIVLHASKKGRSLYRRYGFKRTWEMRLDLEKRKK